MAGGALLVWKAEGPTTTEGRLNREAEGWTVIALCNQIIQVLAAKFSSKIQQAVSSYFFHPERFELTFTVS